MKKEYIETGKIVGTHGINGELRIQPWCDDPVELCEVKILYTDCQGNGSLTINRGRVHGGVIIAEAEGVDTIEAAEMYRGRVLFIRRDDLSVQDGAYLIQDLLGCAVTDECGDVIGKLSDVSKTGANDVWHIETGEKELLIPVIDDVVIKVDVETGVIVIRPLPGLFDI